MSPLTLILFYFFSPPLYIDLFLYPRNQPFAPVDLRSAEELTRGNQPYRSTCDSNGTEPGMDSIRRTLVNAWKIVNDSTTREGF